jgi:hypothetical protein
MAASRAAAHRDSTTNSVAPAPLNVAKKEFHAESTLRETLWHQKAVRETYENDTVQIIVAVLIGVNFIISAINAQVLPEEGTPTEGVFKGFEIFFAVAFLIELIWNMYGRFW